MAKADSMKTDLTPAMRDGAARFENLIEAIDEGRDDDGNIVHSKLREVVHNAVTLDTGTEERSGFLIALAEYLGIVADGAVPELGHVAWSLERGEFSDPPSHGTVQ